MVNEEEGCELEDGMGTEVGVGDDGVGDGVGVASENTKDQTLLQLLHVPDISFAFTLQYQAPNDKVGV